MERDATVHLFNFTCWVCRSRAGGGEVHNGQIGIAQEVAAAANAVDHARAHDMRRVAVAVHVNLNRRVHGDDT